MGVQFDPVLIPGDARARVASGHADEDDLAAEDVLQLVVGGLHHARRLRTQKTLLMRVDNSEEAKGQAEEPDLIMEAKEVEGRPKESGTSLAAAGKGRETR